MDERALRMPADLTEAEFTADLIELCWEYAPKLFALCEVTPRHEDAWIGAWGVEFAVGGAAILDEDGHPRGHFDSADRARTFFAKHYFGDHRDIRLIWVGRASPEAVVS